MRYGSPTNIMTVNELTQLFQAIYKYHDSNKDYIRVMMQTSTKHKYNLTVKKPLELIQIAHNNPRSDLFYTPNTLGTPYSGKNKYSRRLNVLFLDLDTEKYHYSPQIAYFWLNDYWNNHLMDFPYPSIIINSGHGLHLMWLLNPLLNHTSKIAWLWKQTEKNLITFFQKHFTFVDTSVSTATHLLRLPGSINWKQECQALQLYSFKPNLRYDLYEFFDVLRSSGEAKISYQNKNSHYSLHTKLHGGMIKQLLLRKYDLLTLAKRRAHKNYNNNCGYRELTAYIFFQTVQALQGTKEAIEQTNQINNFLQLPDEEIKHIAQQKQVYRFTNQTILQLLNIKGSEYINLKTLRPKYYQRTKQRALLKQKHQQERWYKYQIILRSVLINKVSITKIARIHHLSRQTIYNIIKRYTWKFYQTLSKIFHYKIKLQYQQNFFEQKIQLIFNKNMSFMFLTKLQGWIYEYLNLFKISKNMLY